MLTRTAKTRSAVSAASVMSPEPAWTPRVASASVRSCENSFHTRSAFDFAYEKPQGWDQCSIKMKTKIIFSGPHVTTLLVAVLDRRRGICWMTVRGDACEDAIRSDITKADCCSSVGKAWGSPCELCPTAGVDGGDGGDPGSLVEPTPGVGVGPDGGPPIGQGIAAIAIVLSKIVFPYINYILFVCFTIQ